MKAPGRIFTFYSYKGGTGRSMLVANTGWLLAHAGYDVLMVDWDLEAPGLHRYMAPFLTNPQMTDSNGLIDMVISYATEALEPSENPRPPEWIRDRTDVLDYAVSINWKFTSGGTLSLLPAGRQGPAYATKVNSFSWQNFYDRLGGFAFFEALKDSMRSNFDFILIDSRTGVSDTAGICTVQFPDSLVVCFTLNNQSIEGAAAVAKSVRDQKNPDQFRVFPVPTRLDNSESDKLLDRWQLAKDRFGDLVPRDRVRNYWDDLAILYVPKFAYEEVIAPFGNRPDDPANLNLLAHAKRLTEALAGKEIQFEPIDETIRSNVLAHFAGKNVSLSPLEVQKKVEEEQARAEQTRKQREADEAGRIAAARSQAKDEAKVEAEKALLVTQQRTRLQIRGLVIAGLFVLAIIVGRQVYNQRQASAAQQSITVGDQASGQLKWNDAISEYSKALATITDNPELYAKRASMLVQVNRFEEALKDLDKAIALKPTDLDLLAFRGQTRKQAKNYAGAIEDLKEVVNGAPPQTKGLVLLELVDAYEQSNQFKEAIAPYSQFLSLQPGGGDEEQVIRRANLYLKADDKNDAIKDFQHVAESTSSSPSVVFAQAQLKALGATPPPVKPPVTVHNVVYIQYADARGKDLTEVLRSSLQKQGFQTPSGELKSNVPANGGEVRYFRREDAGKAEVVKKDVEIQLAERRFLISLTLRLFDPKQFPNVPAGQIEVWLPPLDYDVGKQQRLLGPQQNAPPVLRK